MLEVKVISIKKAKVLMQKERASGKKRKKKSPIMEEYEGYLRELQRGKAIGITLKESDKFQTIKYRLNNAAKSLGMKNLKIERAGNKVAVYKEVRPRTKKVGQDQAEALATNESSFTASFASTPELTPASTPVQEDEVMVFDEEYADLMVHGLKTCETSIWRYSGNTFDTFGDEYIITNVERLILGDIAEKLFKEHGFYSPKEFREVWKKRHGGTFDPEQKVWLHQFKKRFEMPIKLDSDADFE